YYYVAFGLLAVALWLVHLVERGRLGFYFRAIRDDQEGAEGIGIPSRLYKVIARSITAAVFAAGGVLYGFWALAVFPEQVLDLNWSTLPIMATVVGGIGRLWGPVLGAFILIPISQIMSTTLGTGPLAGRGIDLIVYGIVIAGADITRARPERVSGLGIARTWQLVRTFGRMTVLENVVCGALKRHARVGEARARALRLLEFTGLASREDVVAANLTLADK